MHTTPVADPQRPPLLDIIHFKWLMTGVGHRVHVERMQSDPDYAQHCLLLGVGTGLDPVRLCARRLAHRLGLSLPH